MFASLLLTFAAPFAVPQESPRDPVGRVVVYRFDTLETLQVDEEGENVTMSNVTMLVRDGVIERLGQAVVIPDHAEVHDYRGSGKVAMPPLVLSHANFLVGDRRGSGRNTRFQAVDSLWLAEDWAEDLLEEGVLMVGVDPPGSGLPGRTSVLRADEQVGVPDPLVADLHLKVNVSTSSSAKGLIRDGLKAADKAIADEEKAHAEWQKAREEWEAKQKEKAEAEGGDAEGGDGEGEGEGGNGNGNGNGDHAAQEGGNGNGKDKSKQDEGPPEEFEAPKMDPNVEPLVDWVRQERVGQVWLGSASDWLHWQDLLGERELPYEIVLRHGTSQNLFEVADAIAKTELRVDVPARISFLPYTRVRANLPAELAAAGVDKLVLSPNSDSLTGLRSYRLSAGQVVAEGLDRHVALRGMSVEASASMGQEDVVGPIAVGGPATFVIWDGDPLDPMTQTFQVLSDGEVVYDRAKAEAEAK
ncbi:MAG: amidohydrolase family protein [Planctomycetota bacterium]|jgi:hypothetical protein